MPSVGASSGGASAVEENDDVLALLPADGDVRPWVSTTRSVIPDDESLFALMDGAAPAYLERGWTQAASGSYAYGDETISLMVHQMETAESAAAFYKYMTPSRVQRIDPVRNIALNIGLAGSYQAIGWVGPFYFTVTIDAATQDAKDRIVTFAMAVFDDCERAAR